MDEAGIFKREVQFPRFSVEAARVRSFLDWPKAMKQRPEELSDAGFFYTKIADRVVCFNCGLGLRAWEEEDDPWEQHITFSANCEYVQLVKGRKYVEEVNAKMLNKWNRNVGEETQKLNDSPQITECSSENKTKECCGECEEKLREQRQCKICCVNELNAVFIPCGHSIACVKCAMALTECPTCRNAYANIVRVYFP